MVIYLLYLLNIGKPLPDTEEGDTLPIGLVVPVTIDCFVDGFLIGVSVAVSRKAAFILAAANCMEMAFLGMLRDDLCL